MKVDKFNFRKKLFGLLDCIAAGGTTEKCGHTTPYFDALTELVCMWFDDFYHFPDGLVEDNILTNTEKNILNSFTEIFDSAYLELKKKDIEDINLLQDDPKWQEVVKAAKEAVQELKQRESK